MNAQPRYIRHLHRIPGGMRLDAHDGMRAAVMCYLEAALMPDERSMAKLIQMASLPAVVDPVVVLPDVHFKEKNFVPSGVAVALRGACSPMLLGPPNDAMTLAALDLGAGDADTRFLDALFAGIKQRLTMFRWPEPAVDADLAGRCLRFGARAVADRFAFDEVDLAAMPGAGGAWSAGDEPDLEDILAALPPGRPATLPDFVPDHDLLTASRKGLFVLDGGSHFVEVNRVAEVLDEERLSALGLAADQVLVAIHTGSCDPGLIAHRHFVPAAPSGIEVFQPGDGRYEAFVTAYRAAANFGAANRLAMLAVIRDAAAHAAGRPLGLRLVSDVPHDTLDIAGDHHLHRKGAVVAQPAIDFPPGHPWATTGTPFYWPTALGRDAFLMTNPNGNAAAFHACSHGAGRQINRDTAVATFDAETVAAEVEQQVRLYRYGVTDFASQAPGSYKDGETVRRLLAEGGLATACARLRPLGTLKG